MNYLKSILFALVIVVLSAGITYYNWLQLNSEGSYSMKMAVFGPVGVVGGIYLLLFPGSGGKPQTTTAKIAVMLVFGIGLAAGAYNLYLMDPGMFGK